MQIRTKNKPFKKPVVITLATVVVIAAVCIGVYFWQSNNSAEQQKSQTETTKKTDSSISNSNGLSNNAESSDSTDSSSTTHEKEKNITPAYEGIDANKSQTLTGAITYSAVANDTLIIRTTINQMLDSGTCKLTLTNGATTVTKTSDIAQNPSSSTCKGFDIPTSELSSGNWHITIKIDSTDRSGTLTGNVNV